MKVFKGLIYKAKRGHIYDTDRRKYNCYMPMETGDYGIVDCWVCTESGDIHPGYSNWGVPVCTDNLGKVVNTIHEDEY